MGNIILLDLIPLNYTNPYLFIFNAYPFFINDYIIINFNFLPLVYDENILGFNFLEFFHLDTITYIHLCKFFLSFNRTEFPLTFLFIYLFILIISIISKIKLYLEFKLFISNMWAYIKAYRLPKISIDINYFYWNFIYLILFYVRKKTWNRLNFRSLELRNKKNPKYHQYQYIKFFYAKFMFDTFFSIVLRLIIFSIVFLVKIFVFCIFSFLGLFFIKTHIYLIYIYVSIYGKLFIKKVTSLNLFSKIFSLVNYFKIEFFIYFFNDRNFLGGLIYYLFNTIYYKIGIFYNSNNWENAQFRTSYYLATIYDKINPLFNNYNLRNIFFGININYIYIFMSIPIFFFSFLFRLLNNILIFTRSLIIYYNFIKLRSSIYFQWRFLFIIVFTFYVFINFSYINIFLYLIFIFNMNIFYHLIQRSKINIFREDIYFYYLGFFVIYLFDLLKTFFYYFYLIFIHLLLKLKYVLFLIVLYKLGIFYLLNLGFLNLISNYFEVAIFIFLDKFLYIILDYYNLKSYCSYTNEFNHQLINIIVYDYIQAKEAFGTYLHNSFLNRIYTLNFKSIDFSRLSWGAFVEYQKSATRQITARKYYFNLFLEFIRETVTFFWICKDYFIIRFVKFYYIYLFRYSEFNIYYYIFKKIYTFIYLLYIYLYFYLKWLYCYFVPLYIMPKFIPSYIFAIYSFLYLFFYKVYFIFFNIFKLFFSSFLFSLLRFIYLLSFLKTYVFYLITWIYYIIYDLIFLLTSMKVNVYYSYGPVEWYLNYLINKSILRENLKDLFINYFRIPKANLVNFNLNESLILGGKLRSVSLLDIDNLNMKKVKEAGLMVHQMDDFLVASKPEIKHNRIFKNRDNLLIFSDIFLLFHLYYPGDYWFDFYMKEQWIFNFFLRKLILYYLIDLYFIYYLVFFLLFYHFSKDNEKLFNIDQMWINLKDEFDYKLLNNNSLFIKALNFYQKNTGKKKKINYLFSNLNNYWKLIFNNYLKNIKKRSNIKKKFKNLKKFTLLGKWKSYIVTSNKLMNFYTERNLYYNNKFFFYWKNYLFFDRDNKFYQKYDKNTQFLYFFLSLIFRKNRYSSLIFFYFDTLNKMYFFSNGLPIYLEKIYDISRTYFERLDSSLFRARGPHWLLHKDLSLILYRDESSNQSDMYSLNFNIIIPYFEKFFFWFIIIIYLYFTKFHWRLTPQVDFLGRINRVIYFQSLIINDNFLYFYNLSVYWINAYFMFDVKHFSYEYNDFVTEWSKNRRYFKHIRKSASFLINNDPLFYHKKNFSYHLLWLDKQYNFNYKSVSIMLFYLIRKFIILMIILIFYIRVVILKKGNILLFLNNNFNILWYLLYFYNKNIINISSYWSYYYKKILSNLEMKFFIKK